MVLKLFYKKNIKVLLFATNLNKKFACVCECIGAES